MKDEVVLQEEDEKGSEIQETVKKGVFSWLRKVSWSWVKSNWLTFLIIFVIVGFLVMEANSMNGRVSVLNDVLNDKTEQIIELQQKITGLEDEQLRLNGELLAAQEEIKKTTAIFWTKFNKIKQDAQNLTPEEIVNGWQDSWPGGKK